MSVIILYVKNYQFGLYLFVGIFLHFVCIILFAIHCTVYSNKNPFNTGGFETYRVLKAGELQGNDGFLIKSQPNTKTDSCFSYSDFKQGTG